MGMRGIGADAEDITAEDYWFEDGSLFVRLVSENRESLATNGRAFARKFVQTSKNGELNAWMDAGNEKVTGPIAYDPDSDVEPDKQDVYEIARQQAAKGNTVYWKYKQVIKFAKLLPT